MPSFVTRNSNSPQTTGVGVSGVPSLSCQTISVRGRLPSPPGFTANSGLRIPCVT